MSYLIFKIDDLGRNTKNKWISGFCALIVELYFTRNWEYSLSEAKAIWHPKKKKCKNCKCK